MTENIKIEKLVYEGLGLARKDGKIFFVKKSVPGDELEVAITKNKKNTIEAEIVNIVKPSADRIEPLCPHFNDCGGCEHMNISYENQLKYKDEIFKEVMSRAGIETEVLDIIPGSNASTYYRNSIRFFFDIDQDNNISFARHNINSEKGLIDIESCLLQSETANEIMAKLKIFINTNIENKASFWQLKIREGKHTHEFMIELITSSDELPDEKGIVKILTAVSPEIKSIYHTVAPGKSLKQLRRKLIFGSPIIYEKIGKYKFQISPESFFQTNSLGVETLYNTIKKFAKVEIGDEVLDLYCGTGSIGIYLSTLAKKVIGVEIVPEAIRDAKDNAKINKIQNIEFFCDDSGNGSLKQFENAIIIVDPPRAGLSKDLILKLKSSNFKRLIYTSCNPATFARDIKLFEENGVKLKKVQPIDMFPQTHHIECVGLLSKPLTEDLT